MRVHRGEIPFLSLKKGVRFWLKCAIIGRYMQHKQKPAQAFVLASFCFLVLVFTLQTHGVLAVECVGKPYGYPGCPTKEASEPVPAMTPPHCGDNIVQDSEGEECDIDRKSTRLNSSHSSISYAVFSF